MLGVTGRQPKTLRVYLYVMSAQMSTCKKNRKDCNMDTPIQQGTAEWTDMRTRLQGWMDRVAGNFRFHSTRNKSGRNWHLFNIKAIKDKRRRRELARV